MTFIPWEKRLSLHFSLQRFLLHVMVKLQHHFIVQVVVGGWRITQGEIDEQWMSQCFWKCSLECKEFLRLNIKLEWILSDLLLFKFWNIIWKTLYVHAVVAITLPSRQLYNNVSIISYKIEAFPRLLLKNTFIYSSKRWKELLWSIMVESYPPIQRRKSNFKTNRWMEKNNQISSVQYPIFYLIYYLFLFFSFIPTLESIPNLKLIYLKLDKGQALVSSVYGLCLDLELHQEKRFYAACSKCSK